MWRHQFPRSRSIDPTSVKPLPEDPLGGFPEEFEDDPIVVDIDSIRSCRFGSVWTFGQFCFLYGQYGKMSLEDAMKKPVKSMLPASSTEASTIGNLS